MYTHPRITFAYSRRPNVNQTERPYTSVHGQCPLCRNSFPATARRQENSKQDTSVVVNTATQTIYYPPHEELFYNYENPIQGGACKLQNGLRPWIDKGVETGYY
jgi:hypothetical protein